jgi:hypothetical protein
MLEEADRRSGVRGAIRSRAGASVLAKVIERYPRAVTRSKQQASSSYGSWDAVVTSRNPVLELEKLAVHDTMSVAGADVSYVRIGRLLQKIRRAVGRGGILGSYESGQLQEVLENLGLLVQNDAAAAEI